MKSSELQVLYIDGVLGEKVNIFNENKKPHKSEALIEDVI